MKFSGVPLFLFKIHTPVSSFKLIKKRHSQLKANSQEAGDRALLDYQKLAQQIFPSLSYLSE